MRARSWLLLPTLAGVLLGCQPKPDTPEQMQARMESESAAARPVIDSLNQEFAKHFNLGHADVVAEFYAPDAHMMPPNMPMAAGREAIKGVLTAFVAMKPVLTLAVESVTASGDHAIERGVVTFTSTPPGASAPVTDTGKYLVHWRRVDGKWMLADDIWNSNLPPMGPPAKP